MSLSTSFETGLCFDSGPQKLAQSPSSSHRSEMLFRKGRWVGVVLGMGLCKATS